MILIPIAVDVPMERRPYANWALIGVTVICYILQESVWDVDTIVRLVLGTGPLSYVGHMFLHAGPIHLAGNMLFLWVFGNAICAKVGNLAYVPLYLALGVLSGAAHMAFDGNPAVGASGAINGIVGMFLMWYPINGVSCFYLFFIFFFIRAGRFEARAFWLILLWLLFDIWGAFSGSGNTAYFAHLGGFFAGAAVGLALLVTRRIAMTRYEVSLPAALGLMETPAARPPTYDRSFRSPGRRDNAEGRQVSHTAPEGDSIRFRCRCGRALRAPLRLAGTVRRCPYCNTPIEVPFKSSL